MHAPGSRRVHHAGGNLFAVAAHHLGRADQWTRVAAANGLEDPWLSDVAVLSVPRRDAAAGTGGVLYPGYPLHVHAQAPAAFEMPGAPAEDAFTMDQVGGVRMDMAGPDAPTMDQDAPVVVTPGTGTPGSGGGGPGPGPDPDPDPVPDPPAMASPTFDMDAPGTPTFDMDGPGAPRFDMATGAGPDGAASAGRVLLDDGSVLVNDALLPIRYE